jgi:hypothetical protein
MLGLERVKVRGESGDSVWVTDMIVRKKGTKRGDGVRGSFRKVP